MRDYFSTRIRHIPNSLSSTAGSSNQLTTLETRETGTGSSKLMQRLLWTVAGDREKNWPIADRRVSINNPRNNCGTHFGSSLLPVSKVTNVIFDYLHEALYLVCFGF